MTQPKITLPAGLIEILREAAAIVEATVHGVDDAMLPKNMRFPIVDELQGFAAMLEDEANRVPECADPGVPTNVKQLTLELVNQMRAVLRRIYIARYHEWLSQRLCNIGMAELAKPFALTVFDEMSAEHNALQAIYAGGICDLRDRLTDTEMAELAKPFANIKPEDLSELSLTDLHPLLKTVQPMTPEIDEPVRAEPQPDAPHVSRNAAVALALKPFLAEGDKVIWREPFRWFDDNGVLSNHYDGMSVEDLAADFNYIIIANYNDVAIIRSSKN